MQSLTEIKNLNELDAALKQVDAVLGMCYSFTNRCKDVTGVTNMHVARAQNETLFAIKNLAYDIAMSRRVSK